MLKKLLSRLLIVIASVVVFYTLLVLAVLLPVLHRPNFQEFLKDTINQRILHDQHLVLEYTKMDIELLPLSIKLNNVQIRSISPSTPSHPSLNFILETPQIQARISLSRLLVGHVHLKVIRLLNPRIFVGLPKLSSQPTDTSSFSVKNLVHIATFLLGPFSHLIGSIQVSNGNLIVDQEQTPHNLFKIKNMNWHTQTSPHALTHTISFENISFVELSTLVAIQRFQTQIVQHRQNIDINRLDLIHEKGSLHVSSAHIDLREEKLEIQDGSIHGQFGTLKIAPLTTTLKKPFSIQGTLLTQNLHFSQFMSLLGITGCLSFFDLNGPIHLQGSLLPLQIDGTVALNAGQFFVTPTVAQAGDPSQHVIQFPKASLAGQFSITPDLTTFRQFQVQVDQTKLAVTGTIVHNPIDVNLDVHTPHIHLDHLKKISSVPIAGRGPLQAHIQANDIGLFIQGNIQLQHANVGPYALGQVQSHVDYADEKIHFQQTKVQQEGTDIEGDVLLNLHKETTLRIEANIKQASAAFIKTFLGKEYEAYLQYFSRGSWFGHLLLDGPPTPSKMFGHYTLQGSNITYGGENFEKISARGSFGQATMNFEELWLQKGTSKIVVTGQLGKGPQYNLNITSELIPLSTLTFIAKNSVPVSGTLRINGSVTGSFHHPIVRLTAHASQATLGKAILPKNVMFNLNHTLDGIEMDISDAYSKWMQLKLTPPLGQKFLIDIDLQDWPWLAFLGLRFPHLMALSENSTLSMKGKLEGQWNKFFQTTQGKLEIPKIDVVNGDQFLALKQGSSIVFQQGTGKNLSPIVFKDHQNNELTLALLSSGQNPLVAKTSGALSAYFIQALTHIVTELRGVITGDVSLIRSNTGWKLASNQGVYCDRLFIQFPFMSEEVSFSPVDIHIIQGRAYLKNAIAPLQQGNISIQGHVGFDPDTLTPQPFLTLQLAQARISVPSWVTAHYQGEITLRGTTSPYTLGGSIRLMSGKNTRPFPAVEKKISEFERTLGLESQPKPSIDLDLHVMLPAQSFAATYGSVQTSLGGKIHLGHFPDELHLDGVLQSSSGSIKFRNHEFLIQELELRFDPTQITKSRLFLRAESTIKGFLIKLNVRGLLDNYQYEFTSVPYLPNREILALLLFDRLQADLTKADQAQLIQIDLGNSIIQQIPLTESIEKETGLAFKIAPVIGTTQTSVSTLSVTKKVTPKLEAQITTEIGSEANRSVSLEYEVSRRVSLRGSLQEDVLRRRQVQAPQTRQRVGVDLRIKSEFD